jgi:HrpA-like RNA helicase
MAAISMAKRLCFERNGKLGHDIGYTIRFDDTTSYDT